MMRNAVAWCFFLLALLIWPEAYWKLLAGTALYYLMNIADSLAVIKARSRYGG